MNNTSKRITKILLALALVSCVFALMSCEMTITTPNVCSHEWIDATCEAPKTCALCGKTEGEALGHDYKVFAGEDLGTHSVVCMNDRSHSAVEYCRGGEKTCLSGAVCEICESLYTEIGTHSWIDATCDEASYCKWCKEQDGEPNGHDYDRTTGKCNVCENKVDVVLYTNTPTIIANGGSHNVVFYAYVNIEGGASVVELYSTNGVLVATMYDDGNYQSSKDEFSNDGVYTCHVNIDVSLNLSEGYYVVVNGDAGITCNGLSIEWLEELSSDDLNNMQEVDDTLNEMVFSDGFDELSLEEKAESVQQQLGVLADNDLILSSSVVFSSETATVTFVYDSGALGAIVLKGFTHDDIELVMPEIEKPENGLSGDAMILWSFDQTWDNDTFRSPYYDLLVDFWNAQGLSTTLDKDVTVEDYKMLDDYEMIILSAYGAYYEYKVGNIKTQKIPGIILSEDATRDKDALYAEDLQLHRIAKITVNGQTKYAILPDFWTHYYADGGLDGSFVVSESGEFFGVDGSFDKSMANALKAAAVEGVLGFQNAPMSSYSRNFMAVYVTGMLYGLPAESAFELAKTLCGENDNFDGREAYGPVAYPIYEGKNEYIISLTLENGSFEDKTTLLGWEEEGDVRVINKLGELSPIHGDKMAILTTGVGSGTSDYTGATEGSVLKQLFLVGAADSLLCFDYNFVSEEPMEYVGSQFDDKMYVEIIDAKGNVTQIAASSINTATWSQVTGINFEGGDTTAFQTGWFNIEFDISQYRGQILTVKFVVYDVGDSAYDSAALIDNVHIKAEQ